MKFLKKAFTVFALFVLTAGFGQSVSDLADNSIDTENIRETVLSKSYISGTLDIPDHSSRYSLYYNASERDLVKPITFYDKFANIGFEDWELDFEKYYDTDLDFERQLLVKQVISNVEKRLIYINQKKKLFEELLVLYEQLE